MDQFLSRSRRDDWRWRRFAVSERILFATFSYTVPNLPDELLNPPVNTQNDRVWAKGKKKEVASTRLLTEREKFVPHLMVCASMCYGGKGWLHFVEEKAKVNADYYTTKLLQNPVEDGRHTLPGQFIFQ